MPWNISFEDNSIKITPDYAENNVYTHIVEAITITPNMMRGRMRGSCINIRLIEDPALIESYSASLQAIGTLFSVTDLEQTDLRFTYSYIAPRPNSLDRFFQIIDIPATSRAQILARIDSFQVQTQTQALQFPALPGLRRSERVFPHINHEFFSPPVLGNQYVGSESAMEPLSEWQKQVSQKVTAHYDATLQAKGPKAIFAELQQFIADEYAKDPIIYKDPTTNKEYKLPLTNADFEAFLYKNKLQSQREAINQLYYAHRVHNIYRYFSDPNPWLALDAKWVEVDALGKPRCANYQQYMNYFTVFWLAASDAAQAQGEGRTSAEERKTSFITILSDLNREHNGDVPGYATRGDMPSCHMGVMSRLFASVIDHDDFRVDAKSLAESEMAAFYRNFYLSIFKNYDDNRFKEIIDQLSEGKFVAELNIMPNETKQQAFVAQVVNSIERVAGKAKATEVGRVMVATFNDHKNMLPQASVANPEKMVFYKTYGAYSLDWVIDTENVRRSSLNQAANTSHNRL